MFTQATASTTETGLSEKSDISLSMAGSIVSTSSSVGSDCMSKEDAKKYVENVMVKVVEVEQQIEMKLTANQYSKEKSCGERLNQQREVAVNAIDALEDLLQQLDISEETEHSGIKSKIKEIRSTFVGKMEACDRRGSLRSVVSASSTGTGISEKSDMLRSVAGSIVSSANSSLGSSDSMPKDEAKRYVENVMVKIVEVEQQIEMKMTSNRYARDNKGSAEKLAQQRDVVVKAIASLEGLLQQIDLSEEAEYQGVRSKVKEIRSSFAGK